MFKSIAATMMLIHWQQPVLHIPARYLNDPIPEGKSRHTGVAAARRAARKRRRARRG